MMKVMQVTLAREYTDDGKLWWVAKAYDIAAQAVELEDCIYEFERLLIAAQALRQDLTISSYQLVYTLQQTINVLSDGERVTGWADEDGSLIDDLPNPEKVAACGDDHDWIYARTGRYIRSCVKCGLEQTDWETNDKEQS